MKSFFKYVLATVVGIFAGFMIIFLIFLTIVGIAAAVGSSSKEIEVKDNSVLSISLAYPIAERESNNPFEHFDFNKLKPIDNPSLKQIQAGLEKASNDSKIKGIYMELSFIPTGWATLETIRKELLNFKESGKFIICFSNTMDEKAYYIGSVADKLYLTPQGVFQLNGLQAKTRYYKGALDKLGVEMQIIKGPDNRYKSAIEPLVRKNMSDENRFQLSELLNDMWNNVASDIAETRGLHTEDVKSFANSYSMIPTVKNIEDGFIDDYKYKDEVISEIKQLLAISDNDDIPTISMGKYCKSTVESSDEKDKIAVVYASGEMVIDSDEPEYMSASKISKAFRDIRKDSSIKAVVFRVNSVGGSALAGEIIWREVELTKQKIPVIVSMGDYAASGGYYISCPADKIFAQKNTITGSIGVYGVIPNFESLLNNKLGIYSDKVKTGEMAGLLESDRALTESEKEMLNGFILNTYNKFLKHVAEGRKISFEEANNIGRGRVWSSLDAQTVGLVDSIGGVKEAINCAATYADLENYSLVDFPKQESPFESIMKDFTESYSEKVYDQLPYEISFVKDVISIINNDKIQTRLPFDLEVY